MINNYKLTNRSKYLYEKSLDIAEQLKDSFVKIEHLLAAFFHCDDSKALKILNEIGFSLLLNALILT